MVSWHAHKHPKFTRWSSSGVVTLWLPQYHDEPNSHTSKKQRQKMLQHQQEMLLKLIPHKSKAKSTVNKLAFYRI